MPGNEVKGGYLELSILVPGEHEEILSNFIIEEIAFGLVTEDAGSETKVVCYIPLSNNPQDKLNRIKKFISIHNMIPANQMETKLSSREIEEIDWIRAYQKEFQSVVIDDLVIKTPWDKDEYPDKMIINIEPKMAFGTGKHETTQLCLQAVKNEVREGMKILDLGVGSGILSIYAAKLGASEIYGLDIDPEAIPNAIENARINNVGDIIRLEHGSMEKVTVSDYYDMVISNLIKDGIFDLFDSFLRAVKPKGILILSGILDNQKEEVSEFIESRVSAEIEITQLNEWLCYILRLN